MIKIPSKVRSKFQGTENKELVKHSAISLLVRIGGAVAAFVMNIVVARYAGAEQAGYFFLAITITTLIATVGRIGADQTVLKFVSLLSAKQEWDKVHGIIRKITTWTFWPLSVLALLLCLFARPIAVYAFHKPQLQWPLFWTAIAMPFLGMYNIHGMALQGIRKVILSVTNLKVLTPIFVVCFILVFFPDASFLGIYYLGATVLNFLVGHYWWKKNIPASVKQVPFDSDTLWSSCSALWVGAIMNVITTWGGQLIAGFFNSPEEVAQLAVSRNTTVLVSFILMAVNNVSAPRFAVMYNKGQMKELEKYVKSTTLIMTIAALPITIFLLIYPEFVLSFFGKDFTGGAWLLRILALGQFVSVISGSVAYLLNMTGHEKDMRNVLMFNALLTIVLSLILNPIYGAIGSALASAIGIATTNIMGIGFVKKRLGFSTLSIFGLK